jgi:uncharacterized protein DUF5647
VVFGGEKKAMNWWRRFLFAKHSGRNESAFVSLNATLTAQFNAFVVAHLLWAADVIPDNAAILIEVEGDQEFNEWSRDLVPASVEPGQSIFPVLFQRLSSDGAKLEIHPGILKRHPERITADLAF